MISQIVGYDVDAAVSLMVLIMMMLTFLVIVVMIVVVMMMLMMLLVSLRVTSVLLMAPAMPAEAINNTQ